MFLDSKLLLLLIFATIINLLLEYTPEINTE